jgi:hypothetical protein
LLCWFEFAWNAFPWAWTRHKQWFALLVEFVWKARIQFVFAFGVCWIILF